MKKTITIECDVETLALFNLLVEKELDSFIKLMNAKQHNLPEETLNGLASLMKQLNSQTEGIKVTRINGKMNLN